MMVPRIFFCATSYQHIHEFRVFVSWYFTSSLVVFLMNVKRACWPLVGDTSDTENHENWGFRATDATKIKGCNVQ
jgi:hypothetical protein